MWEVKKILLTSDGSSHAEKAYGPAVKIARDCNSELIAVYVLEIPRLDAVTLADTNVVSKELVDAIEKYELARADKIMENLKKITEGVNFRSIIARDGPASDKILEVAEKEGVDLIVMGTKGLSGTHRLIGSTCSAVVNHATCPVLAVR